jgi:glycerate kinase
MYILISPNSFKHSLNAMDVALAIQKGLLKSKLDCHCTCFPIGDGGDGTGTLIIENFKGEKIESSVHDALGRKINASFGLIDEGRTAVIEMANASGIRLLSQAELNPLHATSFGTGEQIKAALDRGVKKVIIAMGGSATVDGGCGVLKALGIRFINGKGEEITSIPEKLGELDFIDLSLLDRRILNCEVVILCDVNNFLLGEDGAAAIFGPQKGASAEDVKKLDRSLSKLFEIALKQTGKDIASIKHGGTAGGAAAGLYAFLNAKLVNGIDYFLELTDFPSALEKADLVVTGEGSIDEQTLQGKGPFGVAQHAKNKGLPVIALAGKIPVEVNINLQKYFDVIMPIGNEPTDLALAMKHTAANLTRTAESLGNVLALANKKLN